MSSSNDRDGSLLRGILGGSNDNEESSTRLLSQTTNARQATATAIAQEDGEWTSTGIGTTRTTNVLGPTSTGVATASSALFDEDTTSATEATSSVGQAASSSSVTSLGTSSGILSSSQSQTVSTISSSYAISSTQSLATSSLSSSSILSVGLSTKSDEITSTEETTAETTPPVIVTISAGQNVTLTSSIFSTPPSTSPDNTSKEAANDNKDDTSILNTDNKLFPLGVILVVVGSIIALVTILWFLMKIFGITRRRKRLRGAIPSFVPPERIDFPDESNEKYDAYPSVHHHQRNQSNSSWDYMPGYEPAPAGGRSITPMEGGNLAGFGVGHTNHQDIIPNFPPSGQQYIPSSQMMQDQYHYPQQQYPFMVDNHNYNNNSRDLVPVRSNSQSSNPSNSHDRYGLTRKGTVTDAYGGMETEVQRNGSVGDGHKLNKSREWQSGAGGYV
ncbi:uncharacterized protein L199_003523 [Kwoniella botswanensis]|uniref:uncharacterized protein n=1 Tax=Kwoniella botswanensis TaxID=1268659 RepID=UPI00315C916B